jgi:hypothetical protein
MKHKKDGNESVEPRVWSLESWVKQIQHDLAALTKKVEDQGKDISGVRGELLTVDAEHQNLLSVIDEYMQNVRNALRTIERQPSDQNTWRERKTQRDLDSLGNVANSHEIRLAAVETAVQELGKQALPLQAAFDVFEGKLFSPRVRELIQKAWYSINNPRLIRPFQDWLIHEQLRMVPTELDILAGIYLLDSSTGYAHLSSIRGCIDWMKSSEIRDLATRLMARGLLVGRQLKKSEWSHPGVLPYVYQLSERALGIFLGPSASAATGSIHSAMEMEIFLDALRSSPPRLYLSVPAVPGESRCDGVLVDRIDSKAFNWAAVTAVNYETPEEVRAHACKEPEKEGQVYINMILPFVHGAKYLVIVCLQESADRIAELRNALPSWMSDRIKIRIVKL